MRRETAQEASNRKFGGHCRSTWYCHYIEPGTWQFIVWFLPSSPLDFPTNFHHSFTIYVYALFFMKMYPQAQLHLLVLLICLPARSSSFGVLSETSQIGFSSNPQPISTALSPLGTFVFIKPPSTFGRTTKISEKILANITWTTDLISYNIILLQEVIPPNAGVYPSISAPISIFGMWIAPKIVLNAVSEANIIINMRPFNDSKFFQKQELNWFRYQNTHDSHNALFFHAFLQIELTILQIRLQINQKREDSYGT